MSLYELGGFLTVGTLLAAVGRGVTGHVFGGAPKAGRRGWRGVFYVTMWAHPLLAGAVLGHGLESLPAPDFMGDGSAGRVIWYALSGVFSHSCYDLFSNMIKHQKAKAEWREQSNT
jgi:hypothetical protein